MSQKITFFTGNATQDDREIARLAQQTAEYKELNKQSAIFLRPRTNSIDDNIEHLLMNKSNEHTPLGPSSQDIHIQKKSACCNCNLL